MRRCLDIISAELAAEGYIQGYSTPWIGIDAEVAQTSACEVCGEKGMEYHPFSRHEEGRRPSYRAVAACPHCGHAAEF